jgi:maleylacetate reductase
VFTDVVMHVPVEVAVAAVGAARDAGADSVVAIGGGSAIGTAKAVARDTHLPVVAVPTTYAGSEMTPIWGTTHAGRKTTGRDPYVLPKVVVYDPELTLTLPLDLTVSSGMNALAHLVEGLYAPGVSPLQVATAREGLRALARGLPRVAARPDALDARAEVTYGAWLAGWTLGTTGMGIHHKICHVLGGAYDLPHAPTHSAVVPYAVAANSRAAPDAMAVIESAFRAAGRPADHAAGAIWDLRDDIGAPARLADLGFGVDQIDRAARIVVEQRPVNPRQVDLACARAVLTAAHAGARPPADLR